LKRASPSSSRGRPRKALLPAPYKLGAPRHFTEYRERQDEVILRVADSKARFVVVVAPTGFGKTLFSFVLAKLEADRAAMLTATRGLQDQLSGEYAEAGLVDVRGAGNYVCDFEKFEPEAAKRLRHFDADGNNDELLRREPSSAEQAFRKSMGWGPRVPKARTCDDAPCHSGSLCSGKGSGCRYFDAVRAAQRSEIFSTNYSYWMASHAYSGGLGKLQLMLADEAHEIPEELSRHLRVELSRRQLDRCNRQSATPSPRDRMSTWAEWAFEVLGKLAIPSPDDAARWQALSREVRDIGRSLHRLREVGRASDWVVERSERGLVFEPIWPAPYAEDALWLRTPKIVLTSATVRERTLELVGVPKGKFEFIELPSVFDPDRRPVYIIPGPRLSARSSGKDLRDAVRVTDAILGARADRKSIVHTVSYERAKMLAAMSRCGSRMIVYDTRSKAKAVAEYKAARPSSGAVLVGPALEAGYDFPGDECRCQIIFKLGFPDSRGAVMAARQKSSRWYGLYLTMMDLVQAVGRACRAKADWCENFITDGQAAWFVAGNKSFAPRAFQEAIRWRKRRATVDEVIADLPKPMPLTGPRAV